MARKERYLVGLDVGTSKISAIVGEMTGEGGLDIIGIGLADSRGIRRDARATSINRLATCAASVITNEA